MLIKMYPKINNKNPDVRKLVFIFGLIKFFSQFIDITFISYTRFSLMVHLFFRKMINGFVIINTFRLTKRYYE